MKTMRKPKSLVQHSDRTKWRGGLHNNLTMILCLTLVLVGAVSAAASGPLKILTVGANFGNRATETYVPTVPSPYGGIDHLGSTVDHVSEAGFNALTAGDLAFYDVVITQWASGPGLDLSSAAVQTYVSNGGGLIVDGDYNNYNDLGWVGITGATTFCSGPFTFTVAADPILTDSLPVMPDLVNCHGHFPNFDASVFDVILTDRNGRNAGLAGYYGSGRILITGPDQDFHAHPTGDPEQYQFLLNELEWAGNACDDSASPIAWWKFDEGFGDDAYDSSGNDNDGKLSAFQNKPGGKPLWTAGHDDADSDDFALLFDGSDGYVDAGSDSSLDNLEALTYSAWVKRAANGDLEIFSKQSSYHEMRFAGMGKLRGCIVGNLAFACSTSVESVPMHVWTHVAMTYDHDGDRKVHLYINGVEVTYASQTTAAGQLKNDASSDQNLGRRTNNTRYFWGALDEMLIFDTAVPACRIEQLAEGGGEIPE